MARPLRGLRHQEFGQEPAATRAHPRLVAVMSWSSFGIALVLLVAFLGAGQALPPVPGFLVFVALLALSTNDDVVFPSEYAASADLAVVLAAVVAFRHDVSYSAPFVAPLLLGLLTGPLDVMQWRRRAFVRMAWNSGDRALAGLAAAGAFAAVAHVAGDSVVATVGTALAAAVAAMLVDTALSLVLVTALGNTLRAGWRTVVDIDVLQFPLACAGAAAGFLVTAVGAWAVVPPMLALVLLPELVQARSRVPAMLVRDVLLVLEVGVACLVVAPFVGVPDARTICLLPRGRGARGRGTRGRHGRRRTRGARGRRGGGGDRGLVRIRRR